MGKVIVTLTDELINNGWLLWSYSPETPYPLSLRNEVEVMLANGEVYTGTVEWFESYFIHKEDDWLRDIVAYKKV